MALSGVHLPGSGRKPDVAQSTRRRCCQEEADGEKKLVEMKDGEKKGGKKKDAKKSITETGNQTSPSVTCVRNLRKNSPRVPCVRVVVDGEKSTLPSAIRGGLARLTCALCPCCPWPLFRRRGVRSGKDSRRQQAGKGAVNFCHTLIGVIAKSFWMQAVLIAFGCQHVPGFRTPIGGVPQ